MPGGNSPAGAAPNSPRGGASCCGTQEDPTHFVSVAEWPNGQVVDEWRASEGFKQRLAKIRELLDGVSVRAYDLAAEVTR